MPLIECPGCASRMVNGMCPMCGFADSCYTLATVLERESIIAMGGELMHQFGVATVKESEVVSAAPFEKRDEVVTAFPTELIDCPACSNQLSETAINCPKCGFVLSSKVVTVQKQKRIKAERIGAWAQGIGFAIGLVVALLWLNASNRLEPSSTNSLAAYSTAQNVTYVDRGDFDSAATAHMQERLARLSRKYGLSEDLVAAKLLKAQELLANMQVHMSVQQIADAIEAASPMTTAVSFDELLAMYVTLREKSTDSQAIGQMRGLSRDLGLD